MDVRMITSIGILTARFEELDDCVSARIQEVPEVVVYSSSIPEALRDISLEFNKMAAELLDSLELDKLGITTQ